MTVFPDDFDSDLEIPRIDKNVSEISGDSINSLRDAVFAIQRALGLKIQGNKPSLVDRINVSIDANGFIKKSALDNIGLVTLPVVDRHVGINAAVKESKLDLDYGTTFLFGKINSLRTDLNGISAGLSSQTAGFNLHILGQANFHDGYHIKINVGSSVGVAGLEATTVGDAINEISALLVSGNGNIVPHINTGLPDTTKHLASEIGVNSINFTNIDRNATDVQAALDSIDATQGALGVSHVDNFHSNGILKNINSGTDFNARRKVIDSESGAFYTEGTSVLTIPGVTTFTSSGVESGDILEIATPTYLKDLGAYQIRAIGPAPASDTLGGLPELDENQVAIFHTFIESRAQNDNVIVNIYKPASISSEFAPLACSVRNNETIVDTVSVLSPNAARVVSLGFNGDVLNSDGYEIAIKAGIGNQQARDIVIPGLNLERLQTNQAEPVDARSVAERINAYVSDPDLGHHFPITAYRVGNELAIAHNLVGPDYTLEVVDGYSGNFALGLDAYGANLTGTVQIGNDNNVYSVNGISRSNLHEVFDGYGKVDSSTSTFMLYTASGQHINPLRYGIVSGSVVNITGHPTKDTNGSYTLFSSNSSTVSLFSAEKINAPSIGTTFNVKVTDGHVSFSKLANVETSQGIIQISVDEEGHVRAHQRLVYGTNLGSGVEIIGVSPNFPVGDITILVGLQSGFINFNIIDDTVAGETVKIHEDFRGKFKLYHSNNLDYLTVRVGPGSIPGGLELVTVNEPLNFDESMSIASAHYNGSLSITSIVDTRQFGNLSASEVRDDFIEIFSSKPVSDLRSNGVARGFDVLDLPYYDSITNMEALPVQGGIAYVNGARVAVETQKVIIPSHDSEGNILNDVRRIVAINDLGSMTVVSDEIGELLFDGYNSSAAFGKLLPLYEVTLVNGGISQVTDIRLFINNIDEKIELIIDESNNVVGNFRSLEGALLYATKYPNKEKLTIKIINTVTPTRAISIPDGISLLGDAPFGGDGKHRILNNVGSFNGSALITLEGNNRLENIAVESESAELQASLVDIQGSNVNVEKCLFKYGEAITSNSTLTAINVANSAQDRVRIVDNRISTVYTGISSVWGCNDLIIENNIISNLSGTGGISYGILVSTLTRPVDSITVRNNTIKVPSVVQPSDIRGIAVDLREDIEILRVELNSIMHTVENAMTNGIRIASEVDGGTGNNIDQLFLLDNYITGIRLDDNGVYGIYLDDIDSASVHRNSILNTGVSGANRSDTAMILLGSRVNFAEVDNNVLKNGDVQRGIIFNNTSGRINITNNTMYNLGDEAQYIRGTAPWSNISNNTLTGPGKIGIRWTGARSKITSNILNATGVGTYAFEEHAIFVQTSDIDIINNTITDMRYDGGVGSIFITNANAASDRIKITGNTFSGDAVYKFLDIYGSNHLISNNKFFNESRNTSNGSFGIFLNQVTDSLINGNAFDGGTNSISSALHSGASAVTGLTITNNNTTEDSIFTAAIVFDNSGVEDCFLSGNRFYESSSGENIIGSTTPNPNLVGINLGMKDRRSYPAALGTTAYETLSGESEPHWAMKTSGGSYWEVGRAAFSGSRLLYFPITDVPNGAQITRIDILMRTGVNNAASGWTIKGIKRDLDQVDGNGDSITSTFTYISSNTANGTDASAITSGSSDVTNFVTSLESDGEIVDYSDQQYFLEISNTEATPPDPDEIRVYGITIRFTY